MMRIRRAALPIAAGLMLIVFTSAGSAQTRQPDPFASQLPDGEGKQAVLEFCAGACHSSDHILNARKTPAEWRKTVLQMVANGAQLFPDEVDTVVKYLSTNFGAAP